MFKILLYCQETENTKLHNLLLVIEQEVGPDNIDFCNDFLMLSEKFKDIQTIYDAAILSVDSSKRLDDFITLGDYLQHLDLILIISDEDESILKKTNKLYPRFITFTNNDDQHLKSVINKMILRINNRKAKQIENN